jgi:predicted nuclease of predicted toxin-antitoxin system
VDSRRDHSVQRIGPPVKFKLDENLPVSSAAILTSADQNVDIVTDEGLTGAPDHDVVTAATAAGRILISLDRGLGDIRAYPPGSHAGIVVLRLTDQSTTAAQSQSAT